MCLFWASEHLFLRYSETASDKSMEFSLQEPGGQRPVGQGGQGVHGALPKRRSGSPRVQGAGRQGRPRGCHSACPDLERRVRRVGGGPAGHSAWPRDDSADSAAEAPGQARSGSWSRSSLSCWPGFPPRGLPTGVPHTPGPARSSSDLIRERLAEGRVDRLGLRSHGSPTPNPSLRTEQIKFFQRRCPRCAGTRSPAESPVSSPSVPRSLWSRDGLATPGAGRPAQGGKDAAVCLPAEGAGNPLQACRPSPVPSLPALASLSLSPSPGSSAARRRRGRLQPPGLRSNPPPGPHLFSPLSDHLPSSALKSFPRILQSENHCCPSELEPDV